MPNLLEAPPAAGPSDVTDVIHGMSISDPYRWLENQDSAETREWLQVQSQYARKYLDQIHGRTSIRNRVRELLDVESIDSVLISGDRYVFRKRLPGQDQPCICCREGHEGQDNLLVDPAGVDGSKFTAVRPLRLSPNGQLLLYEIKEGGQRVSSFAVFDIQERKTLSDSLPRGFLRGFAFAPNSRSFYYVHEISGGSPARATTAYRHVLGTSVNQDQEIFTPERRMNVRLQLIPGEEQLGFLVSHHGDTVTTDFYAGKIAEGAPADLIIENATYRFGPMLFGSRILAVTDLGAPNSRIVEVRVGRGGEPEFVDLVPEGTTPIKSWRVTRSRIFVSYLRGTETSIRIFGLHGEYFGELPIDKGHTIRLVAGSLERDEVLVEQESFTEPPIIHRYCGDQIGKSLWHARTIPLGSHRCSYRTVSYTAADGTEIPMFLAGYGDLETPAARPTIMTAYGGFGLAMTPQFSVFTSVLMERGCLFSLPNIRGGSEFGPTWHEAAKRRSKQTAFTDFLSGAKWLLEKGFTDPGRLAVFGGSNAGLLVAAAITQKPEIFRAALCLLPLTDMLRYHLFDQAWLWIEEFGSARDPEDLAALAGYSPYHQLKNGISYPATLVVSGDADQNCNPMHARKFVARLQAANSSGWPVILDHHPMRGHSPTLPFFQRLESLTDRLAFICDQLGLL